MTFVSKRLRWHLVLLRNSFMALYRITTITVATSNFEEALERATAEHCGFANFKCQEIDGKKAVVVRRRKDTCTMV
jgi:hypothetical protein